MYYEHYYRLLNSIEQKAYRSVVEAIKQLNDSDMMLGVMDTEKVVKIVTCVKFDHPEFFYVDFSRIQLLTSMIGTKYQISYTLDKNLIRTRSVELFSLITSTIECLGLVPNDTPVIKHRKLHSYIVKNFTYQYEALKHQCRFLGAFEAYSTLKHKSGVCEGISKVYKLICDAIDLPVYIVEGKSAMPGFDQNIGHAWNICQMPNGFCHIDVTWDMELSRESSYNRYDYFCIPDDWIRIDHFFEHQTDCHTIEYSYFVLNKRIMSGKKELEKYMYDSLSKGIDVLYFKIAGTPIKGSAIIDTIDSVLNTCLSKSGTRINSYLKTMNDAQNVIFYRLVRS